MIPFDEITRINFILDVYTVALLLGLIVGVYYMVRNKKMKKDMKFIVIIGLIFIAFILYYIPRYYAVINLQKKFIENTELQNQQFMNGFEQRRQHIDSMFDHLNR